MEVTKLNIPMSQEMLWFVLDVLTTEYWRQSFDPLSKAKDVEYTRQILLSLEYYRKNFNALTIK